MLIIFKFATVGLQRVFWDPFICSRQAQEAFGTFPWNVCAMYPGFHRGSARGLCAAFWLLSAVTLGQKGLWMCSVLFLYNLMPFRSHLPPSRSNFNMSLWIRHRLLSNKLSKSLLSQNHSLIMSHVYFALILLFIL